MGRKKAPPKQDEGAPLWMVTYGDMMTLLLTFFVLMISFSQIKEDEFKKAMGSLQAALGVLQKERTIAVQTTIALPNRAELLQIARKISEDLQSDEMAGMVEMELSGDGIRFKMNSILLFGSGNAVLRRESFAVLDNISYLINKFGSGATIEGHTDDLPVGATSPFKSNWHLSAERAIEVLDYFISKPDADPSIFHVAAFAEYQPFVPNISAVNRAQNRRVEILIKLKETLDEFTDEEIDKLMEITVPDIDIVEPEEFY